MSKLEELVPPLNLCKLIPQGEFEDSAFVWREDWCINDTNDDATHLLAWKVEKRGCFWVFPLKPTTDEVWAIRNQVFPAAPIFVHNFYTAPTLQEIMFNTPHSGGCEPLFCARHADAGEECDEGWSIGDSEGDLYVKNGFEGRNPAEVALKWWLKKKGIEDEKE